MSNPVWVEEPMQDALKYVEFNSDPRFTLKNIIDAEKYCEANNTMMILPYHSVQDTSLTIDELEEQWTRFNSLLLKQRRISDWKCLELFGKTNKDMYEYLKAKLYKYDIDPVKIEEDNDRRIWIESADIKEQIRYTEADIEDAKNWNLTTKLGIVLPARNEDELDRMWEMYNSMLPKHKKISDSASIHYFGVDNFKHYLYLKEQGFNSFYDDIWCFVPEYNRFIKSYAEEYLLGKESNTTIAKFLFESTMYDTSFYYRENIKKVIKELMEDDLVASRVDIDFLPSSDLPYYSPEEMIDLGVFSHNPTDNYYGVEGDKGEILDLPDDISVTSESWFENYIYHFNGFDTPYRKEMYQARLEKLFELALKLNYEDNSIENRKIKQTMLELGWNPEIPFTITDRAKTTKLYKEKCNSKNSFKFVNMKDNIIYEADIEKTIIKDGTLKPVFIVLTEGKEWFSHVIKTVTNSWYSHCSMSFDPELKTMYSFNGANSDLSKGKFGGLYIENIKKDFPQELRMGVFTIFLKEEDYNRLKSNVEFMVQHIKDTSYSFINLLSYGLHVVPPENSDYKLFCSQFVDRMLKLTGIDLTNKKSNFVSPQDFKTVAKKNNKIYTLYEDLIQKYDGSKIIKKIDGLLKKKVVVSIKEVSTIRNLILNKVANLNEMASIDKSYFGEATKSIYETYLEPCFEAASINLTDKESIGDTFSNLNKVIKSFGQSI